MHTSRYKRIKRENQILFKGVVVFFFCTDSVQYGIFCSKFLPYSERNIRLSWVSPQILQITHHLDFLVSAWWGLFQAFLPPGWFTRRHVMRFTWPANQIWRGGGGQWYDFQQSVIHYIEIPFKKSVPASGEIDVKFAWRTWIKEHCRLMLHTSKQPTAELPFFLLKKNFALCGCCIKYVSWSA